MRGHPETPADLGEWQLAIRDPEGTLTASERHCALTLATFMGWRKPWCYPSVVTIAASMSRAESTVRVALKEIERKGYVARKRGGGRGKSTRYEARLPIFESRSRRRERSPISRKPPNQPRKASGNRRQTLRTLARHRRRAVPAEKKLSPPPEALLIEGSEAPWVQQPEALAFLVGDAKMAPKGGCSDCGKEGLRWSYGQLMLCAGCHRRRSQARDQSLE